MLKKFFMKKMLQSQLKDMPKDQQEKIIEAVSANPELFQKIGEEVQKEMKAGKPQFNAVMEVMKRHQNELKNIM